MSIGLMVCRRKIKKALPVEMATILNQSMSSAGMKVNEEISETAVFGPGEIKENDQCKDVMLSVVANAAQVAKEEEKYLPSSSMGGLSEEDQDLFYAEGLDPKDVAKMLESARAKGARVLAFEPQGEMVVDASFGGIGGIPRTSMALPQGHELGVVN